MGVLEESKDLGSASDWMKEIFNQSEVLPGSGLTHHQYEISALIS